MPKELGPIPYFSVFRVLSHELVRSKHTAEECVCVCVCIYVYISTEMLKTDFLKIFKSQKDF